MRAASTTTFLLLTLAASAPAVAANIICCLDERSKQVCGDILPPACYGRAYREINQSGVTVRQVEAPLTAEQRALRAKEDRRKKEEEAAAKEQARLDHALLQTYGSEADIELARKRAEADTITSIKAATDKITETKKRRKKFEDEAEFYKKRALPPEVETGLRDADFEIQAQESLIAAKRKELDSIKEKYDEDLRRFVALKHKRPLPQ